MRIDEPLLFRVLGWNTQGDLGPYTFYTSKRQGLVWFPKSPPKKPPSSDQVHQRNRFRAAAAAWRSLPQPQREAWELASKRAHLSCHGYNLFVYYQLRKDVAAIRTIERQTGVTLLPLWTVT